MDDRERSKLRLRKFLKIIGITVAALIIGVAIFFVFKIRSEAKSALREAKNTRMALRSADIEMYALGKSVYNPDKLFNIEDGVEKKVNTIYTPPGIYEITSYDYSRHEITGMTYQNGRYVVTFRMKGDALYWDVDYCWNVYHFDDDVVNGD